MPRPTRFVQDVDHVAAELVSCLPALARAVERQIGPHVEHPKPSEAQIALLRHVEANDGATVRRAAEALLMKPNNVSALVTQLTEQGLLERRPDPADKRIAHLHLTSTSRQQLTEVQNLMSGLVAEALQTMTEGELDALGSALGALHALNDRLHPLSH
ncbi:MULTISPECIES: MarR family winged helix-turn-helix transcriptional regulator [unclassified Streptomyces]|uniref:MarR family winged helix-turn-helix transcriptional regulator n=1 Tax=unclassified Streptomyces TaxID=2593676 RepID=UPI0025574F2E|nr:MULTISPECIES: MarR family winged helix-turn-helix transcriptional regulator [unclassified Streptomyces]WRZ62405.1 MarR family winged helix-turn-helix transcriptional regulator [Streptomyces sp. NBC_01257]WSU56375.1 MarR family winged helix-turn-helix transcriptional regulator [Streptomyces sp. NBC_01104]